MPAISFARLTAELHDLYLPPMRRPATWEKIRQVLEELRELTTKRRRIVQRSSDLTAKTIAKWIAEHPDRSPVTCHSLLRSLRAVVTYAVMAGYLKTDPFTWRSPAEWLNLSPSDLEPEEPFDRHLSTTQMLKIINTADREFREGSWVSGRLQALIYALAFTGMRKSEALGLLCTDVDLKRGFIRIRSNRRRRLKTRASAAPLAIAPPLHEVLARWLPRTGCEWLFPGKRLQGPWLSGGPGERPLDQVKALGERAGVKDLTILSFRHTIGTLAEGWGLGELELQRWLRHSRRRTQDSYRKRGDEEAIRATAAKICFARR
jgi:integrase